MKKIISGLFLSVAVVFLFATLTPEKEVNKKTLTIAPGSGVFAVAKQLKKEGVIENRAVFLWKLWRSGKKNEIKAGRYFFENKISPEEVIEMLTAGKIVAVKNEVKLTFPEGWNLIDYQKLLNENGFSGDNFQKLSRQPKYFAEKYGYYFLKEIPAGQTLEGFLFPDTYFFDQKQGEEALIKKMLDNFNAKITDQMKEDIKKKGKTIYEIITMASLIEKEVRSLEDKKIVSGIFWQRLREGFPLQSCATLAYILGENKKQYSWEDTQIKSPYNTYLNPGLPPGPIANPGLESIISAIYPQKTDYRYFLSNPQTGRTVFSKTLAEHNANKVKNGL